MNARAQLEALLQAAAMKHGLDPSLLTAIAEVESQWNPKARNPSGASGLFQLMPSTAKYLGVDPFDPSQAADGAARYLKELGAKWPGDEERMLAAYNTGPGTVRREGINPAGLRYIQKIKQVRQR